MKEKVLNLINKEWFGVVVGLILAFLAVLQESLIGQIAVGAFILGVAIAVICGLLAQAFRYVMGMGFSWKRVLYWLAGGIVGAAVLFII